MRSWVPINRLTARIPCAAMRCGFSLDGDTVTDVEFKGSGDAGAVWAAYPIVVFADRSEPMTTVEGQTNYHRRSFDAQ